MSVSKLVIYRTHNVGKGRPDLRR